MNQVELKRRQIETCSWIIGLINILIFGNILGDSGIAYLLVALECFFFAWTISAGALSDTLGRMLKTRIAKGQFKNTLNIRRRVIILEAIIGAVCCVVLALCAGVLTEKVFKVPHSSFILLVLTPALFFRTISAVLTGFFKGEGSELPVAVAAPLRQLLLMGFGILFANILEAYGTKVSNLLGDTAYTAMYAGVGVAIAIDLSEVLTFLLLGLITLRNRRALLKRGTEGMKQTDTLVGTVKILYGSMWLTVVLQIFRIFPIWIGTIFYRKSLVDAAVFAKNFGLLAGKYVVICGIPLLLICTMLYSAVSRTAGALRKDDYRSAKVVFQSGLQTVVVHGLFFTIFIATMARQLAEMVCKTDSDAVKEMLQYGAILILAVGLMVYFSSLLMKIGKKYHLLGCLAIVDIIFMIILSALLNGGKAGFMSLIYAAIVAVGIGVVLMGVLCCYILRLGIEWIRTIAIPVGVACVSGLLGIFIGKFLTPHLGNLVTAFVCLVIMFLVYWILLILLRCFREQELKYLPGGKLIRAAGQTMRVFNIDFE